MGEEWWACSDRDRLDLLSEMGAGFSVFLISTLVCTCLLFILLSMQQPKNLVCNVLKCQWICFIGDSLQTTVAASVS